MRVAIFGEILERNVVQDLEKALFDQGVTVISTGPVWAGHKLPPLDTPPKEIENAIEKVNAFKPDLIIVMRQSALRPSRIKRLQAPGRKIFVWLPDDPVLYRIYSQTIDKYDLSLHCGGRKILKFYDTKGHKAGVRFPFWADEKRLTYIGSRASGPVSAAFYGLLTGRIKSSRTDTLLSFADSFPGGITVYGRGDIPNGLIDGGYLDGEPQMREALPNHHVILNLPQHFSAYMGTRWEQTEFKNLGHFEIPSRLIQMAALGLPTLTIASKPSFLGGALPHPHISSYSHRANRLIHKFKNADFREHIGQQLRQTFETSFTARLRALYLLQLYEEPPRKKSLTERVNGFRILR